MNCVKGDLAVAKAGEITPEMGDLFVNVVRPAIDGEFMGHATVKLTSPGWIIEAAGGGLLPLRGSDGTLLWVKRRAYQDALLRPIRDNPGNEWFFKAAPLTQKPKQPEAV